MQATSTEDTDNVADNLRRAAIDKSVRGPVLFLFLNGAFWLMMATLLGVFAAVKLIAPELNLDGFHFLKSLYSCEYLSYGRLQPALDFRLAAGFDADGYQILCKPILQGLVEMVAL